MSESKIHSALVAAYLASGVMPQARTAFEGRSFDPAASQSWARITILPSGREPSAMGRKAAQEWTGILQIDIYHPKNTGHAALMADADKALSYFQSGQRIYYRPGHEPSLILDFVADKYGVDSGQQVLIRRAERSSIRQEPAWQSVSVSVYCTAWTFPQ